MGSGGKGVLALATVRSTSDLGDRRIASMVARFIFNACSYLAVWSSYFAATLAVSCLCCSLRRRVCLLIVGSG